MKMLYGRPVLAYDIEVYPNLFMASFFDGQTWNTYDHGSLLSMLRFVQDKVLAGFNNFGYDDIILKNIYKNGGATPTDIYTWSKGIVAGREGDAADANFRTQYEDAPWHCSVDVWQMLNKKGSLKEWECREGADLVAETPFDFTKPVPADATLQIKSYNKNDVKETWRLLNKYWHLVTLRENLIRQYDLPLRAFVVGEAGLAQMVLTNLHRRRTGHNSSMLRAMADANVDNKLRAWNIGWDIMSPRVNFTTPDFKQPVEELLSCDVIGNDTGTTWKIDSPKFAKPVKIGEKEYQFGVGGLHTVDTPGVFKSTKSHAILDLDVASYYPSLMIVEGIYPNHIGQSFIEDYTQIRDERLRAKRTGDNQLSDALKILLNGTFGKLNDAYSPIRSIKSALRVTINGQLEILMLVEMLTEMGATILSANTDGVTVRLARELKGRPLNETMANWTQKTGHYLELTVYDTYARRDINNYVAVKVDGKKKYKGVFDPSPKTGKWDGVVVRRAAEAYLLRGVPVRETIDQENDFTAFLYYQRANNGGHIGIDRQRVGKIARWYVGKKGGGIERENPPGQKVKFAKIPNGGNAVLAMDIEGWDFFGIPNDLDRSYYEREAVDLVKSVVGLFGPPLSLAALPSASA